MTTNRAGRTVGALFLSALLLYGGGSFLVASTTHDAPATPEHADSLVQLSGGATLMLLNSLAVAVIGVLAFGVLKRRQGRSARVYLATRTTEAVLLALAPLGTLTLAVLTWAGVDTADGVGSGFGVRRLAIAAVESSETAYWLAMVTLGIGSTFFCRALMRSALLPRLLAAWGVVGYAVFALGGVLELAGHEVGLVLSGPGGLFEVAAGCYLLVKGFPSSDEVETSADDQAGERAGAQGAQH